MKMAETICSICFEPIAEQILGIVENCHHMYCYSCLLKWININQVNNTKCPLCNCNFTQFRYLDKQFTKLMNVQWYHDYAFLIFQQNNRPLSSVLTEYPPHIAQRHANAVIAKFYQQSFHSDIITKFLVLNNDGENGITLIVEIITNLSKRSTTVATDPTPWCLTRTNDQNLKQFENTIVVEVQSYLKDIPKIKPAW